MIIDRLENLAIYAPLVPGIEAGLKLISEKAPLAPGRYEFDGGFVLSQEGETHPFGIGNPETHEKYADVQIMVEGGEWMGWADVATLRPATPYDETRDIAFFAGETTPVFMQPGTCYIVLPHDAHAPCCHIDEPIHYRKYIIKCKL